MLQTRGTRPDRTFLCTKSLQGFMFLPKSCSVRGCGYLSRPDVAPQASDQNCSGSECIAAWLMDCSTDRWSSSSDINCSFYQNREKVRTLWNTSDRLLTWTDSPWNDVVSHLPATSVFLLFACRTPRKMNPSENPTSTWPLCTKYVSESKSLMPQSAVLPVEETFVLFLSEL